VRISKKVKEKKMRKKRKGFTLVELLVVIAIIALLMGILMPALARVRAIAHRLICGTNLSGIGKAMLIYANDYDDEFPRAGYRNSTWIAGMPGWAAPTRLEAYGGLDGSVTVASSLYLLVKYVDVGPKQFLCKGTNTTEFKLATGLDLIDVWDFGPRPIDHCSYSYHSPYDSRYALNIGVSPPGMAVAADRNPWLDPAADKGYRDTFNWNDGDTNKQKAGNAIAHGNDGQNVLFLDGHVTFEKRSFCGVQDDNIYTACVKTGIIQQGAPPANGGATPAHREDSLLVNEGEGNGTLPAATEIPPYD
jgi:prepilin-type N-terminal cleavage/methylation domain-containing protein/prepilin-type processing-associated H-X9-DG protein